MHITGYLLHLQLQHQWLKLNMFGSVTIIAALQFVIAFKYQNPIVNGKKLNVRVVVSSQQPLVTASTRP